MPRVSSTLDRRTQILRAAVTVFGERGYSQTTISDIAREAGIAHGTIYLYFRGKSDVFQALIGWFTERLVVSLGGSEPREPSALEEDLLHLFEGALSGCALYPQLSSVCMKEANLATVGAASSFRHAETVLGERFTARIRVAIERGEIRDVSPEFGSQLVLELLAFAIGRLLARKSYDQVHVLAKQMTDFVMHGLMGPETDRTESKSADSVASESFSLRHA